MLLAQLPIHGMGIVGARLRDRVEVHESDDKDRERKPDQRARA